MSFFQAFFYVQAFLQTFPQAFPQVSPQVFLKFKDFVQTFLQAFPQALPQPKKGARDNRPTEGHFFSAPKISYLIISYPIRADPILILS